MLGQYLVNALVLGGIYACAGIGFSLIYGVTNIIDLAYGSFIMLGAYTTYALFTHLGIDPFLSIPITAALFFGLGYVLQLWLINRVMAVNTVIAMILTYGVELIIVNAVIYFFSADFRLIRTSYSGGNFTIGPVAVPYAGLGIVLACVALAVALHLFLTRTRPGLAIQAASLNQTAAQLIGVNIQRTYALAFGVGSGLAAAAGSLVAVNYPIGPTLEGLYLGLVFVVAVLGGLGTVWGPLVGGLTLAAVETFAVPLIGPTFQQVVAFSIFVLVLVVRPRGLIGRRFFAEM